MQAAVQAIKATDPVLELKGKVTTVKVTALVEWIKSISKHHSVKGTTLGKVVAAMANCSFGLPMRSQTRPWNMLRRTQ